MTVYGLVTGEGTVEVPLREISISCNIQGITANVTTELLYENEDSDPIEASFIFPIDDNSAVYKFEAVVEGRLIVGECQTKEEARQTYNDAVAAGETAFLMEEDDEKGDVFECKVGNLPPKTQARVTFSYVTQCHVTEGDQGVTTFTYPCVLGARYHIAPVENVETGSASSTSDTTGTVASTSRGRKKYPKTPKYAAVENIPYLCSAKVRYYSSAKNKVKAVKVLNNAQVVTKVLKDGSQTDIGSISLDQDLEVEIHCTQQFEPMLYLEKGNSQKGGMLQNDLAVLQFHPKLTDYPITSTTKGEYIFVIDRSGSMHGERIMNARKALSECLDRLPDDCYFNIIGFGSTHSAFFNKSKKMTIKGLSVKFSETHKKQAKEHAASMGADMGGTEMVAPFQFIYKTSLIPGYPRQIILLTDGAIWGDESAFFNMVKKHSKTTRVFTFGIGFGASTSLVRGLARAGRGECDFIKEDMYKMKKQVARLLKFATSPAVDDVKLDLKVPDGVNCSLIPTEPPPIFMGEHFITYALLSGNPKTNKGKASLSATLTGQVEDQKVEFKVTADLGSITQQTFEAGDLPLHRLAAKAQIKELQDNETYSGQDKQRIELVSTAANIMSRYTSFVGVDKQRKDKVKGKAKQVDIPLPSVSSPRTTYVAPPMAAMSAGGAPRLYGGAGPDAAQALKYLCGKQPELPTDITTVTKDKQATNTMATVSVETNSDDEVSECNTEVEKADVVEKMPVKRKRKKCDSKRLTVKRQKISVRVKDARFARWKDGYYHFATDITAQKHLKRAHRVMRFKDRSVLRVHQKYILSALALCPGEQVSVHSGRQTYQWAMILEYTAKSDQFLVAYGDGTILNCRTEDIVIPEETAQRMRDRREYQPQSLRLLTFLGTDGLRREVTTSDLAELHQKGWINETLVAYWISKVLPAKTTPDLLRRSHVLSPRFFPLLTDCLELDEDFLLLPGDTQSVIIERRWRSFVLRDDRWRGSKSEEADRLLESVDLTEKQLLVVPMYDDLHWYVILVNLQRDVLDNTSFRAQFATMDSYYKCRREHEVAILKRYLTGYFAERGCKLSVDFGVRQYHVPIQGNEWDCGSCTLQCIHNTFRDELKPQANLFWFFKEDLYEQRKDTAACILNDWEKQQLLLS